jgi:septal ring factor EnvC (AmiA/AmiB activator)
VPGAGRPRWILPLLLAAGVAVAPAAGAFAQGADEPQSVAELKAALAELRRRLAAQEDGTAGTAEDKLRSVQLQFDRLVATTVELRRERDGLRRELGAARAQLAARAGAEADRARRLRAAEDEIARLRSDLARATVPPPSLQRLVTPEPDG